MKNINNTQNSGVPVAGDVTSLSEISVTNKTLKTDQPQQMKSSNKQTSPPKTIKYTTIDGETKELTTLTAPKSDNVPQTSVTPPLHSAASIPQSSPSVPQTAASIHQTSPSKLQLSPGKSIRYKTLDGVTKQFTVTDQATVEQLAGVPATIHAVSEKDTQDLTMDYTSMDGKAKKMSLAKLVTSAELAPPKPHIPSADLTNPDNVDLQQQQQEVMSVWLCVALTEKVHGLYIVFV